MLTVSVRVMFSPLKTTLPPALGMTPMMAFIVLVLPAPFAPMSVMISPGSTSRLMPLSARIAP